MKRLATPKYVSIRLLKVSRYVALVTLSRDLEIGTWETFLQHHYPYSVGVVDKNHMTLDLLAAESTSFSSHSLFIIPDVDQ
jgi:hypothetical protein